jgi:hypothetical protein
MVVWDRLLEPGVVFLVVPNRGVGTFEVSPSIPNLLSGKHVCSFASSSC